MKYAFKINKSAVARIAGFALVAVLAVSFVGLGQADTTHQLTVNISDACGPVVAQATIVNGPDDGAFGITNSNGQFIFTALHAGVFYVHIASVDHASKDTGTIVLTSDQTVNVVLDRTSGSCGTTTPVVCSPSTQSVGINQTVSFTASGGDGSSYSWSAPQGTPNSGSDSSFSTQYSSAGSYTVALSQNGQNATCGVTVTSTPTQLTCNPANQTVQVDQTATFTASGGNGSFNWSASSGNPSSGNGSSFSTQYSNPGNYTVTVSSAGQAASCDVSVSQQQQNLYKLTVNVSDVCSPIVAQATVVNGPDDGAFGITNSNGQFIFTALHAGVFYVHVASINHTSKDTGTIVLNSDQTVNVILDRTNGDCNPPPAAKNDAVCVSMQAPSSLQTGQSFSATVVMKNTGNTTWTTVAGYKLGSQNPENNTIWRDGRVALPNSVSPDQQVTFAFNNTAPSTAGIYSFSWRMVQEGQEWFGDTCSRSITVTAPLPAPATVSAACVGGNSPQVNVTWNNVANQTANTLERRIDGGNWAIILMNPPPFSVTSFADHDVSFGHTYTYQVKTDVLVASNAASILVNATNCGVVTPPANQPPIGYLDSADCTHIVGWAKDPDSANSAVNVEIYMDGPVGTGTLITTINANQNRSDVGAHGFDIPTPAAFKNGTGHTVYAYAIDFQTGSRTLLTNSPLTIQCVIVVAPGTVAVTKNVRNVTASQTTFVNSTNANPGDQVEFQMIVSDSIGPVSNVLLSDQLPLRLTYITSSLTVDGTPAGNALGVVSLGNMIAGQNKTVILRAVVADASQFSVGVATLPNTANVTSSSNSTSASANVVVTINAVNLVCSPANQTVQINQTASFTATGGNGSFSWNASSGSPSTGSGSSFSTQYGTAGNYTVTVTSAGASTSCGVSVSNLPTLVCSPATQTVLVNQTASFSATGGNGSFTWSAPNSNNVTGSGSSFSTQYGNAGNYTVIVSSAGASSSCSVAVNQIFTGNPSLSVTKLVRNSTAGQSNFSGSTSANPGDSVQFQIQVTNSGNASATSVIVTDNMPANFNLTSGSTVTNLGTLTAGASQTVNLTANINSGLSFCGTNSFPNTAQASAFNASTVSSTATVSVNGNNCGGGNNANITLTKEVRNLSTGTIFNNSTSASNGDTVQFRLTVRNTNLVNTANNVRVSDSLPFGLNYVPGTFVSDSGSASGNLFAGSEFLGNMFTGQTRILTFNATVSGSSSQTLINQSSASGDNTNSVNAQASVFVSVVLGGNINLIQSKRAFNQTQNIDATTTVAHSNDLIVYALSVQNTGNATATGYVFTDDLSDVLQLGQLEDFGGATFDLARLTLTWPVVDIAANATVTKTFSVRVRTTFPANSDNIMTNTFGNTVNVTVAKPTVAGIFVAPKTGTTANLVLILAAMTVVGFAVFRKREQLS